MHKPEDYVLLQVKEVHRKGERLKILFVANRGECAIPFDCCSNLEEQLNKGNLELTGKTVKVQFTSSGRVNDLVMA